MVLTEALTVKNLTPPGYFNQAEDAPALSAAYLTWWNNILAARVADALAVELFVMSPWLMDLPDYPRTPGLAYLLNLYGFGFFSGTNNQASALYKLVSSAWSNSAARNILLVTQTFCMAPFSWFDITFVPQLVVGNLLVSQMDTGFIIYSTEGSLPVTPHDTEYSARGWLPPTGWTNYPASATFYSRGYIHGDYLVWCTPRPVSDFENAAVFSAAVPVAVAAAGTVCIVNDDGTGDVGSVYYSDGTAWRKNSYKNSDLGLVDPAGDRPDPEAITVWAPNPASVTYAVDSQTPPPDSGPTQGYGTFSTWAETAIFTNEITIQLHQIAGGNLALATLFETLRRVKPTGKTFTVRIDENTYNISDARSI